MKTTGKLHKTLTLRFITRYIFYLHILVWNCLCSVSYTEQRWLGSFWHLFYIFYAFIFTCHSVLKNWMLRPSWCVWVRVKIVKCNFFFVCNGPAVPPAIYSEPRFLESFIVNSQQSILGASLSKNSRVSTLTGEQVSLFRPSSEINLQENIFVVSFHHFSAIMSN